MKKRGNDMIREVTEKEKNQFNALAPHPLQSWEWGQFRKKTGIRLLRFGRYEKNVLRETAQITLHPVPYTNRCVGYFPKGIWPSEEMMGTLFEEGKKHNCIFIKLEPNVPAKEFRIQNSEFRIQESPHPLFTKYTFMLDLTKSEEELLAAMHPKTRYNIKVAQKHGITIQEDNTAPAFEEYLHLTFETTRRQHFYAHTKAYHQLMWETLGNENIAHLFTATYQKDGATHILAAWIVFLFNGVLYYPYGASSDRFRNTMASNLMMWEIIRWGKRHGAKQFDMWGALGPNPDPKDSWYGFHRFKQGYGAALVEFAGCYDLIINPPEYTLYTCLHAVRATLLKVKAALR